MRLEHAAFVSAVYLPGFRINEALSLTKSQFQWRTSLEGELFLVIEQAAFVSAVYLPGFRINEAL